MLQGLSWHLETQGMTFGTTLQSISVHKQLGREQGVANHGETSKELTVALESRDLRAGITLWGNITGSDQTRLG